MSLYHYIALPRPIEEYDGRRIDETKYVKFKSIKGTALEKEFASFNFPDDTPIYLGNFSDSFGILIKKETLFTFTNVFDNEFVFSLYGYFFKNEIADICRKQLYDYIISFLQEDEKVEIYSIWDSGECTDFGPFEEKVTIDVKDILNPELFKLRENLKVEIKIFT